MDQVHESPSGSTSPDVYDQFLDAIAARADLPAHVSAAAAASVTVCTLVTKLTRGQAHLLLEAFPGAIQVLFEPCITHRYGPVADLDDAGFLQRISDRLGVSPAHAEQIADGVFRAVRHQLAPDVIAHVAVQLPRDLRDLWLGTRTIPGVEATEPTARQQLLREISDRAALPVGISASDALAAVMCTFSQRLSGGEAHDVLLGLPEVVRPLLERCVTHRDEEGAVFDRAQLMSSVADELGVTAAQADRIVFGVLAAVKRALPAKEVHDVTSQLPTDLRALWISA
jgi:uncharacterized protein (DUF2267 family)